MDSSDSGSVIRLRETHLSNAPAPIRTTSGSSTSLRKLHLPNPQTDGDGLPLRPCLCVRTRSRLRHPSNPSSEASRATTTSSSRMQFLNETDWIPTGIEAYFSVANGSGSGSNCLITLRE